MNLSLTTHKIETIETSSEFEALLLESQLIKERMPSFNVRLRRKKLYSALITDIDEAGYVNLSLKRVNLDEIDDLSKIAGLFTTQLMAKGFLENIKKEYKLCPKLIGLEKTNKSCFYFQLKKCNGACIGI